MTIQLHRLEGFYWVARCEGYARAARAMPYPITQPAVHQQVKKLEQELGTPLFERVGKDRMVPTPAGRRLQDFVAPFFEALPAILRSVQGGEYGGELKVHTSSLVLRHFLPPWIKRLAKRAPDLQVVLEEVRNVGVEDLRSCQADLVVDHLPEVPADIATLEVGVLRPFVVLPRGHRLAGADPLDLADFGRDPFVAYSPGLHSRELQMQALRRHRLEPERLLSASSAEAILGFVESGLGWSLVPWPDEHGPRSRGIHVTPLTSPVVEFPVVAAWRKDAPANPLLDAALECAPRR